MAEMMAFNRRHTPRHSETSVENRRHSLTSGGLAAADLAAHTIGDHASNASVVIASAPKSNSKKRREKAAAALKAPSSSTATTGATGGERKMSGSQLRLFFLLCVALYFSVIFFADDIVRFAKWMSDEDPVRAWQAPSKPPVAGRTTPKPAQPPGSGDRKKAVPTQTEERKEEKTGNLRGGDDAPKAVEETKAAAAEPRGEEAPGPLPLETLGGGVKEEGAAETKIAERAENGEPGEEPREELVQSTSVVKPKMNADEDAPLESVEDDARKARGETTTEPELETEAATVPADIPPLDLVSTPNVVAPKEEEEGAQVDDTAAEASTRLPETPRLIQAT